MKARLLEQKWVILMEDWLGQRLVTLLVPSMVDLSAQWFLSPLGCELDYR